MYSAFFGSTSPVYAASSVKPDDAYQGLLKGREELITAAKTYLPKRDFEGMRDYLEDKAINMNNFEANAQVSSVRLGIREDS